MGKRVGKLPLPSPDQLIEAHKLHLKLVEVLYEADYCLMFCYTWARTASYFSRCSLITSGIAR